MGVLNDLKKTGITVSDITSQYWCELQMEYNYRYGQKITRAMKEGKAMHAELEDEVNVPILLQPRSYPDSLYKNLYTSLEAIGTFIASSCLRNSSVSCILSVLYAASKFWNP